MSSLKLHGSSTVKYFLNQIEENIFEKIQINSDFFFSKEEGQEIFEKLILTDRIHTFAIYNFEECLCLSEFSKYLRETKNLKYLKIGVTSSCYELAGILKNHQSIEKLNLYMFEDDDDEIKATLNILKCLEYNKKITSLIMVGYNFESCISDEIGKIIGNSKNLKKFVLKSDHGYNYNHFDGILKGLIENKSIESLRIKYIDLHDHEENYFPQLIKYNKFIKKLNIHCVNIYSNPGYIRIFESLNENTCLEQFHFYVESENTILYILNCLKTNQNLKSVKLYRNLRPIYFSYN